MASTIKLKNGSGAPLAANLVTAEPALDLTNKRLYTEDSLGNVIEVGTNPTSLTTGDITTTGAVDVTGDLDVDNINIDGNAITSTDTNGNIAITPNGTGEVDISKVDIDGGAIDGTVIGGTTTAAGSFTTLQADTSLNVDGTVTADGLTVDNTDATITLTGTRGTDTTHTIVTGGTNSQNLNITTGATSGNAIYHNSTSHFFRNQTGATEYAHIDSDGIDVTGTVTADGLTVDSNSSVISTFNGTAATGINVSIKNTEHEFYIGTNDGNLYLYDVDNTATRFNIASNGDISFYEDTGATAKFFWDASAESLGIGTTSPSASLTVESGGEPTIRLNKTALGVTADFKIESNKAILRTTTSDPLILKTNNINRLRASANGDISFYEDTGATAKFLWDASAERLGIGYTASSPNGILDLSIQNNNVYDPASYPTELIGLRNLSNTAGTDVSLYMNVSGNGASSAAGAMSLVHTGDGSGALTFQTRNSGTMAERVRISEAGNVGIGTTAPVNVASGYTNLTIDGTGESNRGGALSLSKNDTEIGRLITFGAAGFETLAIQNMQNKSIVFRSTGSDDMTLDASGNLLVGTTSDTVGDNTGVNTNGSNIFSDGTAVFGKNGNRPLILNRGTNAGDIVQFKKDGTTVGSISVTASATSYNTSSDERLKENIQDADSAGSVIDDIQVRQFDWINDGEHQRYGMIAQELNTVAPEAVTQGETENDMWAVDYSKLVPMLVKEIQDLRKRVGDLEGN